MNQKQQLALTLAACICIFCGLLAADSLWWILMPVWAITVLTMRKDQNQRFYKLQVIDLTLLAIGIVEIVLYFCSTYPTNSIHFPLISLTFITLWLYIRRWIVKINQKQIILGVLTATGGVLALLTVFFFVFFWVKVTNMGFDDITQFRYLYRPFGMPSNDWVGIMLAFMPFTIVSFFLLPKPCNRLSALAFFLITISIIISLSRGAIFSLIFFWILLIVLLLYFKRYSLKRLALGCLICFTIIALVCIPIRSQLFTIFAMTKNTSQVRSIEGRMNKWNDAVLLFSQHFVTGVGAGNFALRVEPLGNQRESASTGRSTNSWLQLAAEKGMTGLSAYGLFFAVWAIGMLRVLRLREKHNLAAMICGAGIIACFLRETTFSSLFDRPTLLLLIILLLWFTEQNGKKIKIHKGWITLLVIPILYFGILQTQQKSATRNNKAFVRAYERGEYNLEKLQKSLSLSSNNAILHANKGIYLLSKISGYDSLVFLNNIPDSTLSQAKVAFKRAVELNPADAAFQSNLGILNLATGDTVNALQHFKQSLNLAPHQSIYHILCGIMCCDDSLYSHQRFVHALYYSPDVLDSKWFAGLYEQDSIKAKYVVKDAQTMICDSLVLRKNDYLLQSRLAKLLLYQGKTDDAENLLREVTQAMPNLNRPWLMLGDIASARNDTVALQYYERAMQLDPNDAWAKLRTGDWHLNKDDLSKSFGYYIDALRSAYLTPTEHSRRTMSMYRTQTVSNDVIPTAFYWYIRPYLNTKKLAIVIAQGYEQEGNTNGVTLYRKLANGEIGIREAVN